MLQAGRVKDVSFRLWRECSVSSGDNLDLYLLSSKQREEILLVKVTKFVIMFQHGPKKLFQVAGGCGVPLELKVQRQEDRKFKANKCYVVRPC